MRTSLCILLLAAAASRADTILITEVVTDPQSDHSESSGGNGLPFDLEPGEGTVSSVDEFVELFNASNAAVDLTGFVLELCDTTPSSFVFGQSSGVLRFSTGSSLESLKPGAFALIGNPPGALNNEITLELREPFGDLVDSLAIEDGNATGLPDEAVYRIWTGEAFLDDLAQGAITPLALPPAQAVPEPQSGLLLALSALAGARAIARRGRRASRRRPPAAPRTRPSRRRARGAA